MTTELTTAVTNARGIPQAKFIENIDLFINNKSPSEELINSKLSSIQDLLNQFKFMEESKKVSLQNLKIKVPDLEQNISIIKTLQEEKKNDEFIEQEVNYQLNDTIFTKAVIDKNELESVFLWLGADVMLEYPIDEALEMLNKRLKEANENKDKTVEDLEFLRENITTMEVNLARLYNWDVKRRRGTDSK
ncbi:hypothetical protein PACTADRAFT_2569 [Pachysolen tannophilus NRRL Y-2460]|uniref:Prefoldin subunit 3 n=1 Tax=Pachysolen tannophilus NRRL Y-2460 TaxID=669874 RepID=A0A1E4TX94_PACTA|nr:hypothetical protein PACTADRAFT_2569 [Pachysolen tannophilus NRRL Y-2460]